MKIETFINHGTVIEIESVQTMNLSVDKGEVHIAGRPLQEFVRDAASHASAEATEGPAETDGNEPSGAGVEDGNREAICPFSEAQQKTCGIKMQPAVVLGLLHAMQPLFVQKVDWLSPYSVLLRRRWVDDNLRAWCRLVDALFGVHLDPRTLSADLRNLGGSDYTRWTDADRRIVRRKQLAADFDTRLTQYFECKRAELMQDIVG